MTLFRQYLVVARIVLLFSCLYVFNACSTGIEGTKTIKMSREDKRLSRKTDEELLGARITSQPISKWRVGKRFLVADNKAALAYDIRSLKSDGMAVDSVAGAVLTLRGISSTTTPGGGNVSVIELSNDSLAMLYNVGRRVVEDTLFSASDMPMLIDLDMVQLADSLLRSSKVWTNSRLWYDVNGSKVNGEKFRPVTILSVVPGNVYFPLKVVFRTAGGVVSSMYMNPVSRRPSGNESRTFSALFLLEDPRVKYSSVSEEFWNLICKGKVANGMTKMECRLALGGPSDVVSGHDWDSLLDVWKYPDGSYLQFQDGLLVNFRNL